MKKVKHKRIRKIPLYQEVKEQKFNNAKREL